MGVKRSQADHGIDYFSHWDGIGAATPAGFANWQAIFTNPELIASVEHAFVLIIFYTALPVGLGLVAASVIRAMKPGPFSMTARVTLFIPQVLPLVAAGVAWTWMYSPSGLVNQFLRALGLGSQPGRGSRTSRSRCLPWA